MYLPLVEVNFLPHNAHSYIHNIESFDIAVFISQTAVAAAIQLFGQQTINIPTLDYFAIGKASASALAAVGIAAQYPDKGSSSEDLLALPALEKLENKKILLCASLQGRRLLQETFIVRGAQVDLLELYSVTPIVYSALQLQQQLDIEQISVLSATSAKILYALDDLIKQANLEWHSLPLIVTSQRLVKLAQALSFSQIHLASSGAVADIMLVAQTI
jgi:uroporphyrinogen-III synthase